MRTWTRGASVVGLLLAALATTGEADAQPPRFAPDVQAKLRGALPLAYGARPRLDGRPGRSPARDRAPVIVETRGKPGAADWAELRRALHEAGVPLGGEPRRYVSARLSPEAVSRVARLPAVHRIWSDGSPFGMPPPLDVTTAEVEADAAWRSLDAASLPVTGTGVRICNSEDGFDVFHPMFFRPDGGYLPWIDVDGDGQLTLGVDGVDRNGDGLVETLRFVDAIVKSPWGDDPIMDSDDGVYTPGHDWLYVDDNASGAREYGPGAGYADDAPSFGEPFALIDDVNANGRLDVGEKIVLLGSSKFSAFVTEDTIVFRGDGLSEEASLWSPQNHGTASSGVLAGGSRLGGLAGMAPGAELIAGARVGENPSLFAVAENCIAAGAQVMLHEYAPWAGYFLDGSEPLEQLISSSSAEGVAHIVPAGNLSGSEKLYKRDHPADGTTTIPLEVPGGDYGLLIASFLWRDPARPLSFQLQGPLGSTTTLPGVGDAVVYQGFDGQLEVYAETAVSDRGTAMLLLYLFDEDGVAALPAGGYQVHVTDAAPSSAGPLTMFGFVQDEVSGWGLGIRFTSNVSEDHLIGFPGTSDDAITVSAYTGVGHFGGVPGDFADYSGRGRRIDDVQLLDVAGPDDPITSGYAMTREAVYSVFGGTSGASPHVAGAAALLKQVNPQASGGDIRQALRDGALADAATGTVPNEDFGYGKLRVHRSLYGVDAPAGTAPTIAIATTTVPAGELAPVSVVVADAEEDASALHVELDRDYDGVYDEIVLGDLFEVLFEVPGSVHHLKLRVTDSTGRSSTALATLTVSEPTLEVPDILPLLGEGEDGGCGCRMVGSPSRGSGLGWLTLLAAAALLRRRRR